jgi:hypothetical protein
MCTLTYLPLPEGPLLTFNRDERAARPHALPPSIHLHGDKQCWHPTDPQGGGTWVALEKGLMGQGDTFACLMNGAFRRHTPTPPYRRSRGLILLECLNASDIQTFAEGVDLEGIEPFTLVRMTPKGPVELRWDGEVKYLAPLPAYQAHIWASATLYEGIPHATRQLRFFELLQKGFESDLAAADALLQFHLRPTPTLEGDGICLVTPLGGTVSVTQVWFRKEGTQCRYLDLYAVAHHPEAEVPPVPAWQTVFA